MNELKIVDNNGGLMNMNEAAAYLQIKKSTLYQMTMRREIPCVKIGKLNRFRKIDLDNFINNNLKEANQVD
ncbi:MAG: helix-turn-helix domain-containing protein [Planctomycetes bacterium]|nr:helix-turn-helix domain-containing protein [Planctomycetota bacterium]